MYAAGVSIPIKQGRELSWFDHPHVHANVEHSVLNEKSFMVCKLSKRLRNVICCKGLMHVIQKEMLWCHPGALPLVFSKRESESKNKNKTIMNKKIINKKECIPLAFLGALDIS